MNTKLVVVALFAAFLVMGANCVPVAEEFSLMEDIEDVGAAPRQKRVTCDLLSASANGYQLNHSACAAHCLVMKYKGGYCDKGVCHCRR